MVEIRIAVVEERLCKTSFINLIDNYITEEKYGKLRATFREGVYIDE